MDDQRRTSTNARLFRFIRRYFLGIVLVVVIVWTTAFFELGRYTVYQANPSLQGQEQAAEILQKVGQLIQLPPNETPTMATISDAQSAKQGQPFLTNAENGDVLIVYPNAREALLYRPSTNKLIAVGPVDSTSPEAQTAQASVSAPAATSTDASSTISKKK
jgi:hypothetical protein